MKILFVILITTAAVVSFNYSYTTPATFDGNCSIGIKDEEKKDKRIIASYINMLDEEKILVFRINDTVKSILLTPDTKWEFPPDSGIKKTEHLKEKKGTCIAIDYEIQNGKKSAKKIKILPEYKYNRKLIVKYEDIDNLIKNKAVFIDSRPADVFSSGAIPGAVNIPLSKLRDDSGRKLLPEDKNAQLVFYCSGTACNVSFESAALAIKAGYKNAKVYHGGYPEYIKNENIYSIQPSYLQNLQERNKPFILIDIRKKAAEEHIPGAFAADPAKIDELKTSLPQKNEHKENAMIIVYASGEDDDKTSIESARSILSWGYKNVCVLNGGFKSYLKSGSTDKKNLLSKINYYDEEKYFISANDFHSDLIKNTYKDHIFIDLRDDKDINDEPAISAIGAIKVSFDKLYTNQPKNKYKNYIIYSDSPEKSIEARELLLLDNFKRIQIIKGFIFSDGKGGLLIGDKKIDADQVRKLKR